MLVSFPGIVEGSWVGVDPDRVLAVCAAWEGGTLIIYSEHETDEFGRIRTLENAASVINRINDALEDLRRLEGTARKEPR